MESEIKLVGTGYNKETFNIEYFYDYKFSLESKLENHDLLYGFKEDFIEMMKEKFEFVLRDFIENSNENDN